MRQIPTQAETALPALAYRDPYLILADEVISYRNRHPLDAETHGRLLNWSRWATSGGLPHCHVVHYDPQEPGETVDELGAMETEAALVIMRRERKREYRLVRIVYIKRWTIPTCCDVLRCGPREYYRRLGAMYGCLRNLVQR